MCTCGLSNRSVERIRHNDRSAAMLEVALNEYVAEIFRPVWLCDTDQNLGTSPSSGIIRCWHAFSRSDRIELC